MKKIVLIHFVVLCGFLIQAQTDTIFRMNGDLILANVTEINESSVRYEYPNESFSNDLNKSTIYKIHFKSGRKEEFASTLNVSNVKSCIDWENVQISNIPSEVEGMFKIDDISAKSETWGGSVGKMQSRTLKKIKIQTAMLGGNTCFITHQNTEGKGYYKSANVAITAVGYTSKKVYKYEVKKGDYLVNNILVLKTNNYSYGKIYHKDFTLTITEDNLQLENGFPKINVKLPDIGRINEYTVIYTSDIELILSGTYTSGKGKTTYYNVFLEKLK